MPPKQIIEGWKPENMIVDRKVKYNFWEERKNVRYPSVKYAPLLGIERPSKEQKGGIRPMDIFNYYFEDFIQGIVLKSAQERYEAQKERMIQHRIKSAPTLGDIRRVIIAVLIIILNNQRWTKHYWSTSSSLRGIPLMNSIISRDKFWALYPIVFSWEVLEGEVYFNRKFKEVYSPSSYISIDELMCKFKGRTNKKVYMPRKRIKTGIKIWSINDSTPEATYLWDFATYLKDESRKTASGHLLGSTVQGLLQYADEVLPRHCFITGDRYFGTYENGRMLNERNRGFLLSCRIDRPRSLWGPLTEEIKDGETKAIQHATNGITAFAFKDKRATLLLLSNGIRSWGLEGTHAGYDPTPSRRQLEEMQERERTKWTRPLARELYNYSMRGSDVFSQRMEAFRYNRRQQTWKRAVRLYHFSMALCNAHILYGLIRREIREKKVSHYRFIELLIEQMLD